MSRRLSSKSVISTFLRTYDTIVCSRSSCERVEIKYINLEFRKGKRIERRALVIIMVSLSCHNKKWRFLHYQELCHLFQSVMHSHSCSDKRMSPQLHLLISILKVWSCKLAALWHIPLVPVRFAQVRSK